MTFQVSDCHNVLKCQEKYSYGKLTAIKLVIPAAVHAGSDFEKEWLLRIAKNCQQKVTFFLPTNSQDIGVGSMHKNIALTCHICKFETFDDYIP